MLQHASAEQTAETAQVTKGGISEAASKNRRGRPSRFPELLAVHREPCRGPVLKWRTFVEHILAGIALNTLGADDNARLPTELSWLDGKHTLLAQLGRIAEYADVNLTAKRLALILCKEKPSVKAGAAYLRRLRMAEPRKPNRDALSDQIARCVDRYRSEHPDMTFEAIMNALNDVYSAAENFADRQRERERAAALATPSIGHNRGPALDDEAA